MKAFLGLVIAFSVLTGAPALWAHGDENHADAKVETAIVHDAGMTSPNAPDAERPASQHETSDRSVWTSLHPATVHFPIAFLLAAALIEAIGIARPSSRSAATVTVLIWGGAAGAVVAAIFGWIHTGLWLGGDATMQWHRWTGTALAIAAILAVPLERRTNRWPFRCLLFLIAAALLAQGYWGGELAHGPNHLGL